MKKFVLKFITQKLSITKHGGTIMGKSKSPCKDLGRKVRKASQGQPQRGRQSPGREERVKSFPPQYKRKECAERLGFLLLQ